MYTVIKDQTVHYGNLCHLKKIECKKQKTSHLGGNCIISNVIVMNKKLATLSADMSQLRKEEKNAS